MTRRARQLLQISVLVAFASLPAIGQVEGRSTSVLEQVLSVTSVGGVAISPDGSHVAYTLTRHDSKGNGLGSEIHIVSADGDGDRLLVNGGAPAWSPDGDQIAYFSSAGGSRQIWIIPATGGEARQVTRHRGYIDRFRWGPDSKRIAILFRQAHAADLRFFTKAPHPLMPIVVDGNKLPMNQLAIVDIESDTAETVTPSP